MRKKKKFEVSLKSYTDEIDTEIHEELWMIQMRWS